MKIPEILIGKDALPYMEFAAPLIKRELRWWASDYKGFGAVGAGAKWVEKQQDYYCDFTPRPDLAEVHAFLSSPFKPEMITELFAGCEWVRNSNMYKQLFIYGKKEFTFRITSKAPYQFKTAYYTRVVTRRYMHKLLWPKTLNDFISDCQRAGIKLRYKS